MSINIIENESADKRKIRYTLEWGRGKGQRKATGLFTYKKPKTEEEKTHNFQVQKLLSVKKSQLTIEQQGRTVPGYIPEHKLEKNFFTFVDAFHEKHKRKVLNNTLGAAVGKFKEFVGTGFISPEQITESYCSDFRDYLVKELNGETPKDYFGGFKRILKTAAKEGYFNKINPAADVQAKFGKSLPDKEWLETEELLQLLKAPCSNKEVRDAFIFSCYTGLRNCDIRPLDYSGFKGERLTTRIIQSKTGKPIVVTLHPIAKAILDDRRSLIKKDEETQKLFGLPTEDGANKILKSWVRSAEIDKKITWHCARKTFSVLLQDEGVDIKTVSLLLGHSSIKYAADDYARARPKDQMATIMKLPSAVSTLNKPKLGGNINSRSQELEYIKELRELGFTNQEIKARLQMLPE